MEQNIKLSEERINDMLDKTEVKFTFLFFVFFNILIVIKLICIILFEHF